MSTVNLAFTYGGLMRLALPLASLLSFPLEFQQGMKARQTFFPIPGKMLRRIGTRCGGRSASMRGWP